MAKCDRCQKLIHGTSADPVCATSLGTHHYACMRAASAEREQARQARAQEIFQRRSESARKRFHARRAVATVDASISAGAA